MRLLAFCAIGYVLLALGFVFLCVIGLALFGIAMVRSDLFGVLFVGYWLIGLPVTTFLAWRIASRQHPLPREGERAG